MTFRSAIGFLAGFALASAASIVAPTTALAFPIQMAPNPLGDWIGPSPIAARVSLQSGDTQPVPTVVLQATVDGTQLAPSTVNFDFLFDVDIVDASVSAQSGAITVGPLLLLAGDPRLRRLAFVCGQTVNPCSVDVTFELASPPTTLDVTDSNNFFSNSPGAPNQTLSATFGTTSVPVVPALGPAALVTAVAGLLVAGRWAQRRA